MAVLKSQSKSNEIQGMKERVGSLQRDNEQKEAVIQEKQNAVSMQNELLNAMKENVGALEHECKAMEHEQCLVKLFENESDEQIQTKAVILKHFLQIDGATATSLLSASAWSVRDAVDRYYMDEYKIDVQYETVWKWRDDDGSWKEYDAKHCQQIEALRTDQMYCFSLKNQNYEIRKIHEELAEQSNVKTHKKRECKRVQIKVLLQLFF